MLAFRSCFCERLKRIQSSVIFCSSRGRRVTLKVPTGTILSGLRSEVRLPWALSVSSLQTSRVPCRLYDRNAAALRVRVNTEDCIIKTIFLLKTFTKMKCLAPIGPRRDLASFKHHDYRTMKTESFMYIYISVELAHRFLSWGDL